MTATITVKTRAVGAAVKVGDEETTLPPHTSRDFNIDGEGSVSVKEEAPAADDPQPGTTRNPNPPLDTDNVPGREQNDKLTKSVADQETKDAGTNRGKNASR